MGMDAEFLSETNKTGLILITGIFFMFFMGMILLLFFHFSKKKIIQKELEKKNLELEYQRDLLQATIEVQEDERKRIAQDLHDDISSKLNIVSLNSHMLATPDLSSTEVSEITGTIIDLVHKALDNSRRIAHNLLPPVLDKFGLAAGLDELYFELNSSKALIVKHENNVTFSEVDKDKQLHVFRIIQELINNSIRHGKATIVSIVFNENENGVVCTYSDNGIGFDTGNIKSQKGLGMKNIESRIIFLNGSISIKSVIDKGTNVVFNF